MPEQYAIALNESLQILMNNERSSIHAVVRKKAAMDPVADSSLLYYAC
jgi:hypothetical protein